MFTCDHGITHTATEFNEAIKWAARAFPDHDLVHRGFTCWIEEWRKWKEAGEPRTWPNKKEVKE